jgi:hypothetical protein
MKRAILFLLCAGLAFGQSATPINYPFLNSKTYVTYEAQALAVGPVTITAANLIFIGGYVACGATGRTFTLTDGNSVVFGTAISVAANTIVSLDGLAGAYVSKGFSIAASGTGCTFHAYWRQ